LQLLDGSFGPNEFTYTFKRTQVASRLRWWRSFGPERLDEIANSLRFAWRC
jgi:hypothetical protein